MREAPHGAGCVWGVLLGVALWLVVLAAAPAVWHFLASSFRW